MNSDIRINISWLCNTKRKALIRRIGAEGAIALIDLWLYAAQNRPKGDLTGMTDEEIADAAQWQGDPIILMKAIGPKRSGGIGFLDGKPGNYKLHDWKEHNPWAFYSDSRSAAARIGAKKRWDAERMRKLCDSHKVGNAPTPTPTPIPTPTPSLSNRMGDEPDLIERISTIIPYTAGSLEQGELIDLEARLTPEVAVEEFEKCTNWYQETHGQKPRIKQVIKWLDNTLTKISERGEVESEHEPTLQRIDINALIESERGD